MANVVKSWNGIVRASIKTWDGIASASVKTINGLDAVVSGGYTLVYNSINTGTDQWPFGSTATGERYYASQKDFSDASALAIGKVVFKLVKAAGSITGNTYRARIWTVTGNNLDTNVATSDGVTGSDFWSATEVDFIFSTPYTTTGSTNYTITIDSGADSASNYAAAYNRTPSAIPGSLAWHQASKVLNQEFSTYDLQMKIYTSP